MVGRMGSGGQFVATLAYTNSARIAFYPLSPAQHSSVQSLGHWHRMHRASQRITAWQLRYLSGSCEPRVATFRRWHTTGPGGVRVWVGVACVWIVRGGCVWSVWAPLWTSEAVNEPSRPSVEWLRGRGASQEVPTEFQPSNQAQLYMDRAIIASVPEEFGRTGWLPHHVHGNFPGGSHKTPLLSLRCNSSTVRSLR